MAGRSQEGFVPTIQGYLEKALLQVLLTIPSLWSTRGALAQASMPLARLSILICHANRNDHAWVFGANSNLPADISLRLGETCLAKFSRPSYRAITALSIYYL